MYVFVFVWVTYVCIIAYLSIFKFALTIFKIIDRFNVCVEMC